jgi:hypothetical protein
MAKIGINFKSEKTANSFKKQFVSLSLSTAKVSVKGTKVAISVTDPDEEKIVRSLISDVKEEAMTDIWSATLIESINLCINNEKARNLRLIDGGMVRLTPARARAFVQTHDQMSEENQVKMRRLVIESSDAFAEIMDFCKQRSKTNGVI